MPFNLDTFPIEYSCWDEGLGHGGLYFHGVKFLEAFPPNIPKGRTYKLIHVDYIHGTIHEGIIKPKALELGPLITRWRAHGT